MKFTREQILLSDAVIDEQLSATESFESVHRNGEWKTVITPVFPHSLPKDNIIDLSGEWSVKKWPFSGTEEKLVHPRTADTAWEKEVQPGKLFSSDPELAPESIDGWDRNGMKYMDPDDGAVIRRTVIIPAQWAKKEIFINCDAIYPAGRVYVNGALVADHQSGLTPICRNITALVKAGKPATIAVRLYRYHPYIIMDMPRHSTEFGGMPQPVYIFAKEKCHVEDYYLPSVLDESFKSGKLEGNVRLYNASKKKQKGTVTVKIFDPKGVYLTEEAFPFEINQGQKLELPISVKVNKPMLWNDEHPHLYRAELTAGVGGLGEEKYEFRTGFRRLDFKDCRPYLNGNPIKFRGVNHLSAHPQHGLHTPKDWLKRNLELMKLANVNCIRTHYMGPRYLADLCDEMGIYILQELPVDWGTHYIHDPEWVGPALMRLYAGVCRDRNHPSIMLWSIGNENMPESDAVAANGWMHLNMYDRFVKRLDPNKATIFPPPGPASKIDGILELRVGDVADIHYSFVPIKNFLRDGKVENPISWEATMETNTKEEALARGWTGTWFSTEYSAFSAFPDIIFSPNHCSIIDDESKSYPEDTPQIKVFYDRLKREWGFMRHEESCLGGAYFPWMSGGSSTSLGHPFSWTLLSEDCDWGVMTPELLPKPNFWVLRNLFSPVWFPDEVEYFNGEDNVIFELWNQYNDINLNQCTIRVSVPNTCYWWRDITVDLAPGERKMISLPIRAAHGLDFRSGKYRFWLIDPNGFVATIKDVTFFNKGNERGNAESVFDVSPEPAYIDRKNK